MNIALLVLAYPHGRVQTFLNGGLMNLGSRLMKVGFTPTFTDLNHASILDAEIRARLRDADYIGICVIGPPYIPMAVSTIRKLREAGFNQPILVGGEGIARLPGVHFKRLFSDLGTVLQVCSDENLKQILELEEIPSMYETSMVPMLRTLGEDALLHYLTHEFSIFLSQGCRFRCRFCSAAKGRPEMYRSIETLAEEMEFICAFLQKNNVRTFHAYLSNLDAFNNAERLEQCLKAISCTAERFGVSPNMRCLATSKFFVRAHGQDQNRLARLREYGLWAVGFGVDGVDIEVWKRENKRHNNAADLEYALCLAQEAGMTPEVLMIVGFPEDSFKQMVDSTSYCFSQALRGRVIRPYLAKTRQPGNDGWIEGDGMVERFVEHPALFIDLDNAMLASRATHPEFANRVFANVCFLSLTALLTPFGSCLTRPLFPTQAVPFTQRIATLINSMMPFDR